MSDARTDAIVLSVNAVDDVILQAVTYEVKRSRFIAGFGTPLLGFRCFLSIACEVRPRTHVELRNNSELGHAEPLIDDDVVIFICCCTLHWLTLVSSTRRLSSEIIERIISPLPP